MINIQPFEKQYEKGVIDLILPIQQIEFNVPITLNDQLDLLDIPNFYQKEKGNFWIALEGDLVVGSTALIDIGNQELCLRKMFVKAEYRGKEHKIAQNLLEIVINWCKEKDINAVYLGTRTALYAARRFYEKNGFTEVEKASLPSNFPLMAVDDRFYALFNVL
jgi:N-acetylglutamate synthase-like GNAT family acetyltransferase